MYIKFMSLTSDRDSSTTATAVSTDNVEQVANLYRLDSNTRISTSCTLY